MLVNTDGLPGPEMVNMLGKPGTVSPRYVRGPADHFSCMVSPSLPVIATRSIDPVIASKPVAKIRTSSSNSAV